MCVPVACLFRARDRSLKKKYTLSRKKICWTVVVVAVDVFFFGAAHITEMTRVHARKRIWYLIRYTGDRMSWSHFFHFNLRILKSGCFGCCCTLVIGTSTQPRKCAYHTTRNQYSLSYANLLSVASHCLICCLFNWNLMKSFVFSLEITLKAQYNLHYIIIYIKWIRKNI